MRITVAASSGQYRQLFEFHLGMLFLATSGPLGKSITLPPALTICVRAGLAAFLMYLYLQWRGTSKQILPGRDRWFIGLSGLLFGAHWVTYFLSLQWSSVAVGMLSAFTYPVMSTFLEPLFFKVRFRWHNVGLGGLMLAGLWCLIPELSLENDITKGVMIGLVSALFFAIRNLLMKPLARQYPSTVLMFYQLLIIAFMLLPALWYYPLAGLHSYWPQIVLLALVTTNIGHTLLVYSFQYFTVTKASIMSTVQPVYGIALGALFLAERPDDAALLGGALILLATIIASLVKESSQ